MKWNIKKPKLKLAGGEWHRWFAWYPVRNMDETRKLWLETVERRLLYSYGWDTQFYVWEYREV